MSVLSGVSSPNNFHCDLEGLLEKIFEDWITIVLLTMSAEKRMRCLDTPPVQKMKPDEATINFWRLRAGILCLPLHVRLHILFWWLLDHLSSFEYCEDVSTSHRVLVVVFSFEVFFLIRSRFFSSSCTLLKTFPYETGTTWGHGILTYNLPKRPG